MAARRAAVLCSSAATWRRSVVVEATPRRNARPSARQKSSTSGAPEWLSARIRISTRGQWPRMARTRRRREARASAGAGGTTGRAQHGGDRASLAVEDDDRLEAGVVVVGVEQPQLLRAMVRVEGVVHVQDDPARHLAEAAAGEPDHGPTQAQQGARAGQVLQARDG